MRSCWIGLLLIRVWLLKISRYVLFHQGGTVIQADDQVELQQRFTDQEERLKSDLAAHIEQVESKNAEVERLKGTIDEYKVSVEELNRALTAVSTGAGNNDGQYLASTIQEYDRLRRNNEAQYHEFENIKRNLMADLSNRCEKVCPPFRV